MFSYLFQIAPFQLFRNDEDSDLPPVTPAPKSGFVSRHECTYAWRDGDVFVSETEASGWYNLSDVHG